MSNGLLTITTDWKNATVKTDNNPAIYLIEKEYTPEEYAAIRAEAEQWNVEIVHEDGYDYGYGRSEHNRYTSYREITDDILIVKDGHFAGIMMKSSGCSYNKRVTVYDDLFIAFASRYTPQKAVLCARQGDSFSSDDHEKWDIDQYYLRKKADNKQDTNQSKKDAKKDEIVWHPISSTVMYEGKEYVIWVPSEEYDAKRVIYARIMVLEVLDDAAKLVHPYNDVLRVFDEKVRKSVFALYKERFADTFTFEE